MQEEIILEIPEPSEDSPGWQPPELIKAEIPEKENTQSCADVFFVQYVICILLLTALFSVRLYDENVFRNTVKLFQAQTHADSEPWVLSLIALVKNLWS